MASKHYGWQKRWVVDVDARTATHDTGLVFHFVREPNGWSGEADKTVMQQWAALQQVKMPLPDVARHGQRLAREAGDIWQATWQKAHAK